MKASAFPKLDRGAPSAARHQGSDRVPRAVNEGAIPSAPVIDEKTWKAWRMKLGATRKEANRLWLQYQEWVAQEAQNGPVRRLSVKPWQDWEREFRAFLDEMPRKPYAFIAMVARIEMKRAQLSEIRLKKAARRDKYIRQYERRRAEYQE